MPTQDVIIRVLQQKSSSPWTPLIGLRVERMSEMRDRVLKVFSETLQEIAHWTWSSDTELRMWWYWQDMNIWLAQTAGGKFLWVAEEAVACQWGQLYAHRQKALHKRHLLRSVRVISVFCTRIEVELQSWCRQQTLRARNTTYTKCRLCSASWGWASNAGIMQRHLKTNILNKECVIFNSLYWNYPFKDEAQTALFKDPVRTAL
jgi:hypothetical protein